MDAPPFVLKSGLGDIRTVSPDLERTVVVSMLVFGECALEDAALYATAAGRQAVLPRDMLLSLKALAAGDFNLVPDVDQRFERLAAEYDNDDTDDSDGDSSEIGGEGEEEEDSSDHEECPEGQRRPEEQSEGQPPEGQQPEEQCTWTRADDQSEIAIRLNTAEERWSQFTPTTPLSNAMARAIRAAEEAESRWG